MSAETTDPLVVFMPSGRRGHVAVGTTVLDAARELGVDLDSVCGGRGICSKCQVAPQFGEFAKLKVHSREGSLSAWNAVEERYDSKRGLAEGRRLGCQAQIRGDVVVDVPPESQVHKQVVRKRAEAREYVLDPATRLYYVEVAEPDMENPKGDLERLMDALWVGARAHHWGPADAAPGAEGAPRRRVGGDRRRLYRPRPLDRADRAGLARLPRGHALRRRVRRRLDHDRLPPGRPAGGQGAGLGGPDEPADPLRRGPDEPGLLRHDEPRRRT